MKYDTLAQGEAAYLGSDPASKGPISASLTDEIVSVMGEFGARAEEIASRLYNLRDRLFGPQAPNAAQGGTGPGQPPVMGFADAFGSRAADVRRTLVLIDHLSAELANRL